MSDTDLVRMVNQIAMSVIGNVGVMSGPGQPVDAAVVQQQAEQRQAMRTQRQALMQDPKAAAAVDRAAQREAMMKLRDEHLAARGAVLKDLYAVLTPEQKALADQRLSGGHGRRMAMHAPGR